MNKEQIMAAVKAKMVAHSDKVDIRDWHLAAVEEFSETLQKAIVSAASEALLIAVEDYPALAWFPAEWGEEDGIGGEPVDDPLAVFVTLPLGAEDLTGPTWAFSLRDIVQASIDSAVEDGGKIGAPYIKFSAGLRDGLRDLAQKIDDVLPSSAEG